MKYSVAWMIGQLVSKPRHCTLESITSRCDNIVALFALDDRLLARGGPRADHFDALISSGGSPFAGEGGGGGARITR